VRISVVSLWKALTMAGARCLSEGCMFIRFGWERRVEDVLSMHVQCTCLDATIMSGRGLARSSFRSCLCFLIISSYNT
jgi:hypothetical protein